MTVYSIAPGDRHVPWLGQCKPDWQFRPIKYLCRVNARVLPEGTNPQTEILYIDIGNVGSDGTWTASEPMLFGEAPSRARRVLVDGDVLVSTVRTYLRAIAHVGKVEGNLVCSTGLAVISAGEKTHSRFLAYWIRSANFVDEIMARSVGVNYPAVNAADIENLPFPLIALREQRDIADFLDRETERIDGLVARKQRQIELLQEKRGAFISRAVTEGLDANVKMKSSGIDWLGEIPEHWEIVRFPHYVDYQEGPGIMADDFVDFGVPLLRIGNIQQSEVQLAGCNYLSEEKVYRKWQHFRLAEKDLLISCSASTGLVSEVTGVSRGAIAYTGIIRLRPANQAVRREYIRWLVSSDLFFVQIDLLKTGSIIQHFGPLHLRQMKLVLPPIPEQDAIVRHLDTETSRIDVLAGKIESSIARLEEYRTALISAAVTGKIDVREEAG